LNSFCYFEREQAKLQGLLGEFAGESNVSSRSLPESSAIHFVWSILDIGTSVGRACPIITSELLLPNISVKKSRARFDRLEKLGRMISLGDSKPDDF
jgi:hypothetical protein